MVRDWNICVRADKFEEAFKIYLICDQQAADISK